MAEHSGDIRTAMASIMVLGAGPLATPVLKRLGEDSSIIAVGINTPYALASARQAWCVERCDVTDLQQVRALAKLVRPDALFSLNDLGLAAACQAAADLNLLSFTEVQAQIFLDKALQKNFLRQYALPHATSVAFRDESSLTHAWNELRATVCFMKPAQAGGGSRGVRTITTLGEALLHLRLHPEHFRRGGILEEPISGTEHTVEVLISGHQWKIVSFSDKINYPTSSEVVQYQIFPGPIASRRMPLISTTVGRLVEALGAAQGALHLEVITSRTSCTVLEFSGRPGGTYNFLPIPLITMGFDYPKALVQVLLGNGNIIGEATPTGSCVAIGHCNVPAPGTASGYSFTGIEANVSNFNNNASLVPYAVVGNTWGGLVDDLVRPGYVFVRGNLADETLSTARSIVDSIEVVINPNQKTWGLTAKRAE